MGALDAQVQATRADDLVVIACKEHIGHLVTEQPVLALL